MSESDRQKWDSKYAAKTTSNQAVPDEFLVEACARIQQDSPPPESSAGSAVDLACGTGHNSIWLADQGWSVDGVDISANGLQLAARSRPGVSEPDQASGVPRWIEADLDNWRPARHAYGLAVIFRFLDRDSIPSIVNDGLKKHGWLVYETFSREQLLRSDSHISNPSFTLDHGELPALFPDFEPVIHRVDELEDRTVVRFLGLKKTD